MKLHNKKNKFKIINRIVIILVIILVIIFIYN
jgi:hypothetical protein